MRRLTRLLFLALIAAAAAGAIAVAFIDLPAPTRSVTTPADLPGLTDG